MPIRVGVKVIPMDAARRQVKEYTKTRVVGKAYSYPHYDGLKVVLLTHEVSPKRVLCHLVHWMPPRAVQTVT